MVSPTQAELIHRPAFSALEPDRIEARLGQLLDKCRATVERCAAATPVAWETVMQPQEQAHSELDNFWSPVSHLNSVMNTLELREVYNRCLPRISEYYAWLGQHQALYNTTLALSGDPGFSGWPAARQRCVANDLRDFRLGGVSLAPEQQARYKEIAERLAELGTVFSDHVLDATNAWQLDLDSAERLAGLPESAVAAARERAGKAGIDGCRLNLEFPTYLSIMTFANDRALRETLYTAFCTRASEQGPQAGQFDNTDVMQEILCLRAEKATLLDYPNYAELSMVPKMVESAGQVTDFLQELAGKALPAARREYAELQAFATTELGMDELEAWDVAWVSEKLKKAQYDLSDEDLKPYFPANKVIPGLFGVLSRLFGLSISPVDEVDVYHPSVQCFAVLDAQGVKRGEFYLDTYAREHKRGGAWMDVCTSRLRLQRGVQLPIAYLVCNLTPPVGNDPALLTHQEVTTLFHEFGHGLHHMLTAIDESGVSGISGVEWDAVELPSQFLENWCWERESLDLISGHYQSDEKLPGELLERLRRARRFQAGMQTVRQIEFALFDIQIHQLATADKAPDVQAVLNRVRNRVAVVPAPAFNRFQHSFSHIFAGGYAAGYFSYKWAEVLSADAFERFSEEGLFSETAGQAFLNEVLAMGGSRPAMESFIAFRGREPDSDALLKQSGLIAA